MLVQSLPSPYEIGALIGSRISLLEFCHLLTDRKQCSCRLDSFSFYAIY